MLREAELLIVEDKRRTAILLNKFEIGRKDMIPIAENISEKKVDWIIEKIKNVNIACLVSDSGMPVISDPGYAIVKRCWEEGIELDVVPGPTAHTAALAVSGFPANKYVFLGFLPKKSKRRKLLKSLCSASEIDTIAFYESPYRFLETLQDILDIFGNVEIFVGREMTKIHQEFFKGRVKEAVEHFKGGVKGEITVILRRDIQC